MGITNDKFELKAYSKKELAEKYQVSVKTFDKWLKPFTEKIGEKRMEFLQGGDSPLADPGNYLPQLEQARQILKKNISVYN